jgi:cardiolipin synthase
LKKIDLFINIPNILTVVRILLTPLFVIFLLKDMFPHALVVFTVAGISDALDGLIARCFNQRTLLGAYIDPIADKLLVMSAFISLAVLGIIPSWLAVVVISRDILIVLGIAVFAITGINIEIRPNVDSKCTTVVQLTTVILVLLGQVTSSVFIIKYLPVLYWLTAGLVITSGMRYLYIGLNLFQNSLGNNHPMK